MEETEVLILYGTHFAITRGKKFNISPKRFSIFRHCDMCLDFLKYKFDI